MREGDAIRTFKARRRVTPGQAEAIARLLPRYGQDVPYGRTAPLVLEIGSGMGEATAAMAAADPDRDVLAVEVHTPGVGALLRRVQELGLTNVRIAEADGLDVLRARSAGSLDEVRVFFPDPWPKARHHKRRLVSPGFAELVADRLRPGGRLHVATDWPSYAEQARQVLSTRLDLVGTDRDGRPVTRFEQQARDAGRTCWDLVWVSSDAVRTTAG
ncbi:MAG: tRNA (guanosine(46)-N7)-methyltransferase TrmB [Frankiales bacterium]|nr:tRNA (guanosine(46)-N7)-methyltransferase TrmB [Frankiales bacterium]